MERRGDKTSRLPAPRPSPTPFSRPLPHPTHPHSVVPSSTPGSPPFGSPLPYPFPTPIQETPYPFRRPPPNHAQPGSRLCARVPARRHAKCYINPIFVGPFYKQANGAYEEHRGGNGGCEERKGENCDYIIRKRLEIRITTFTFSVPSR